jgi:mannosyltransferase OCH1-like enzyme
MSSPIPSVASVSTGISRVIIQTWKTYDVPAQWQRAQRSVIDLNPCWKYVFLSDDDCDRLVARHFPSFVPTFRGFPHGIQRADAVRYVALYVYGGVYLDLDFQALRPFDELKLSDGKEVGIMRSSNAKDLVTNAFMVAARPRQPFWLACIDEMTRVKAPWWAVTKHFEVMMTTGPFMLDRVYRRHPEAVSILRVAVPCDVCQIERAACHDDTQKYFVMPVEGGSWHAWDSKALNFIFCNAVPLTLAVALLALLAAVALVVRRRSRDRPAKDQRSR